MGLSDEAKETLAFLVRHHLLLARTATRRDLDDESVVRRVAAEVGTPDRLRMLYLLTVADSLATGPSAWTDWKATLVRDLFFKVIRVLRGEGKSIDAPEAVLSARQAELGAALATDGQTGDVEEFLAAMPAAYLLAQPTTAVQEHFALISRKTDAPVRVAIRHLPGSSHDELTLVAADRPGLLWRVCGVFSLHGVNVLEARAYTSARGEVLDVFRLVDAFEESISEDKRADIVHDLGLVLDGRLSLSYRLGRKLKHYRAARTDPAVPVRVSADNAASDEYTVVEVHARDRLGLLYAIARAMSELQLDIHLAKLATRGPEAIDVFYVRNLYGQKVTDPDHLKEMERALLFELEEFGLEGRT
jgi:[protein-PII] uridylyltransferase